jgi:hypothetical protein
MMQQILDPKTDNATRMVLIYSLGMISGPTFIEDLPNTFDHFAAAGWHFGEFSEKPSFSSALKFGLNLTAGVGSLSFVMGGTLRLGGASVDTGLSARGPSGRLPSPVSPPMPGQIVPGGRPSPTAAMPIGGGHSFEIQGSFFRMSEGTVLQFPVASGELLDAEIAEAIENTGRVPTRGLYPPRQYGPGDLTPEHLLLQEGWGKATSPPGLYATTVTRPTLLSDIIKPNMGLCVFTGCRTPGRY